MSLQCGIVGLPNVGKSTLFNAMAATQIDAQNYPFCTIEPNVGVVPVPDERLARLAELAGSEQQVPAAVEFVDIAGLVEGASRGEGLGNKFLAHIREANALAQVVRCFVDDNLVHVAGHPDPVRDCETIVTELLLADLATVERAQERLKRQAKTGDKSVREHGARLEVVAEQMDCGVPVHAQTLDERAQEAVRPLCLLTAKPMFYVANVDEAGLVDGNEQLTALQQHAKERSLEVVVVCAALEAEIAQLDAASRQEFLVEVGLSESGLHRVIQTGYRVLQYQTYFTAGPKETRAWTIRQGTQAPQAAGVIHTDMEKGFICAEVIAYEDYLACGGEAGAREAGRSRTEGRDYELKEADVVHFRFNV